MRLREQIEDILGDILIPIDSWCDDIAGHVGTIEGIPEAVNKIANLFREGHPDYLVFDSDFGFIPLQDLPNDLNTPVVCLDGLKRLGDETWKVLVVGVNHDHLLKGLFCNKHEAIRFAKAYNIIGRI